MPQHLRQYICTFLYYQRYCFSKTTRKEETSGNSFVIEKGSPTTLNRNTDYKHVIRTTIPKSTNIGPTLAEKKGNIPIWYFFLLLDTASSYLINLTTSKRYQQLSFIIFSTTNGSLKRQFVTTHCYLGVFQMDPTAPFNS